MRVNVYAEEMTDRVVIISKQIDGQQFTGVRFYLELPATVRGRQYRGPFLHQPGDDDSAAVTFWGKRDLRGVLRKSLALLDAHHSDQTAAAGSLPVPVIGGEFHGGLYAGRTLQDNEAFALILLPGEFEGEWDQAMAWAEQQDAALPSRFDQLVLWTNLRDQFQKAWYWSSEQLAAGDEYAWIQTFLGGRQDDHHKDHHCRARAVRRVPI